MSEDLLGLSDMFDPVDAPVDAPASLTPREFLATLVHDKGGHAKMEYLPFRAGETLLKEGQPVRQMMVMRVGEVQALIDGKHICTYVADPNCRLSKLPILSASDYCYSRPSTYTYVAETSVEVAMFDTPVILRTGTQIKLERRVATLALLRNMTICSDMATELREMIKDEFERTGLPCFNPEWPEDKILRYDEASFGSYYLDFAVRVIGNLSIARRSRATYPSTHMQPLQRPEST